MVAIVGVIVPERANFAVVARFALPVLDDVMRAALDDVGVLVPVRVVAPVFMGVVVRFVTRDGADCVRCCAFEV